MGWLGAALLGLTIGMIANAVGFHGRQQTILNLITGICGALGGQLLFGTVGPTVAGMTMLPVVGGATILVVLGTVIFQTIQTE